VFVSLVHHEVAPGSGAVLTEVAPKPDDPLFIYRPIVRYNPSYPAYGGSLVVPPTVHQPLVQLQTRGAGASLLTLVTTMDCLLAILVLRHHVHGHLALEAGSVGAEFTVISDSFMLELLVLQQPWLRGGSIVTQVTGEHCADGQVLLQSGQVNELDLAPVTMHNVWRMHILHVTLQAGVAREQFITFCAMNSITAVGQVVLVHL